MLKRLLLVVSFTVLVLFGGRPAEAVPIISAPFVTVGVGVTFTIPISITGAVDFTSWQFDLGFSPAIVKANSVTEGPFMTAFGATLFIPGAINNGAGLISI